MLSTRFLTQCQRLGTNGRHIEKNVILTYDLTYCNILIFVPYYKYFFYYIGQPSDSAGGTMKRYLTNEAKAGNRKLKYKIFLYIIACMHLLDGMSGLIQSYNKPLKPYRFYK